MALTSNARALGAMALAVLVSACASPVSPPPATVPKAAATARADTGLDRMERLALTANRCWFKSKDPAFAKLTLAPELSSFSGRPRFLLVPKNRPEERPLLVVEGRSGSTAVDTYGPLLETGLAGRLESDLGRWRAGSSDCNA